MNCWAPSTQRVHELFRRNLCLSRDTRKRPNFDVAMHWHNTTFGFAAHDDVATRLASPYETETLKGFDNCSPEVGGKLGMRWKAEHGDYWMPWSRKRKLGQIECRRLFQIGDCPFDRFTLRGSASFGV